MLHAPPLCKNSMTDDLLTFSDEAPEPMVLNIQLAYVILIFLLILLTESSENLNHRSYREICGKEWHKEYTHLHNSVISGQRQGKYLISVPVHAGLADNVLGYVSGFLWALLSNRAYMILAVDAFPDQSQRTISFAFHSPHINWTAPTINQSLYDCILLQLSRPGSNTITIGIQVRDVSSSTAPEHFFCVNTLIEYYKKQGIPHKPEVVSDRSSSSSSNIFYNKEEMAYIDRIAMQDSARDMRLLSLTDIQVISMSSGFGLVASMMKLSRNHIIFRVAKGWKKNCSANPSGDPIGYLRKSSGSKFSVKNVAADMLENFNRNKQWGRV
eukprot:gene7141-14534_t